MSILPPSLPGRIPAVPVPSTVRPPLPVEPVQPIRERVVPDEGPMPRTRPGSIVDTWASPEDFALSETTTARRALAVARPAPRPVLRALPGRIAIDLGGPETTGEAAKLAPVLRRAVESSGVFYESHLAQWVEGHRATVDVAREVSSLAMHAKDAAEHGVRDSVRSQQIDFLRQGEVGWMLPAPFQGTTLWVGEPIVEGRIAPEATPLVKLEIDLPGRGALRVVLRLVGRELFVDLDGGEHAGLGPAELLDLGTRLQGLAGLHLASLRTSAVACSKRTNADGGDTCTWTNCDRCLARGT